MGFIDYFLGKLHHNDLRNHSGFIIYLPLIIAGLLFAAAIAQSNLISYTELGAIATLITLSLSLLIERGIPGMRLAAYTGYFSLQLSCLLVTWILSAHFLVASKSQINELYLQSSLDPQFGGYLKDYLSTKISISYLEADRILNSVSWTDSYQASFARLNNLLSTIQTPPQSQ